MGDVISMMNADLSMVLMVGWDERSFLVVIKAICQADDPFLHLIFNTKV